jgi:hypothetical protein
VPKSPSCERTVSKIGVKEPDAPAPLESEQGREVETHARPRGLDSGTSTIATRRSLRGYPSTPSSGSRRISRGGRVYDAYTDGTNRLRSRIRSAG